MGTMVAIGAEGDLLDESGNPPRTREILVVDSLAAIAGGAGGVLDNGFMRKLRLYKNQHRHHGNFAKYYK